MKKAVFLLWATVFALLCLYWAVFYDANRLFYFQWRMQIHYEMHKSAFEGLGDVFQEEQNVEFVSYYPEYVDLIDLDHGPKIFDEVYERYKANLPYLPHLKAMDFPYGIAFENIKLPDNDARVMVARNFGGYVGENIGTDANLVYWFDYAPQDNACSKALLWTAPYGTCHFILDERWTYTFLWDWDACLDYTKLDGYDSKFEDAVIDDCPQSLPPSALR